VAVAIPPLAYRVENLANLNSSSQAKGLV
jgi:hypothetical protein